MELDLFSLLFIELCPVVYVVYAQTTSIHLFYKCILRCNTTGKKMQSQRNKPDDVTGCARPREL